MVLSSCWLPINRGRSRLPGCTEPNKDGIFVRSVGRRSGPHPQGLGGLGMKLGSTWSTLKESKGSKRIQVLVLVDLCWGSHRVTNLALTLLAARCSCMLHLLNLFCIIQRMSTGGAAAAYTSTTYPSSGSSTEFPRVTPNHAPRIPTKWCEMPWHSGKTNSDSMQLSCILMSFFPQVWLTTISAATRTTPTISTKLQQSGALRPIPALSGKPAHLWVWLLQLLSAFAEGFQIQIPLVDWQPCKKT